MKTKPIVMMIVFILVIEGCEMANKQHHFQPNSNLMNSDSYLVKLRGMQTRAFETTDKEKTLRTIIGTLQDLGFVIDKTDATLGIVSATKLKIYILRITVSVREGRAYQLLVRANAQYEGEPITHPEPYNQFFAALEKNMFLTAHKVD